jgi:hypothetical protein
MQILSDHAQRQQYLGFGSTTLLAAHGELASPVGV